MAGRWTSFHVELQKTDGYVARSCRLGGEIAKRDTLPLCPSLSAVLAHKGTWLSDQLDLWETAATALYSLVFPDEQGSRLHRANNPRVVLHVEGELAALPFEAAKDPDGTLVFVKIWPLIRSLSATDLIPAKSRTVPIRLTAIGATTVPNAPPMDGLRDLLSTLKESDNHDSVRVLDGATIITIGATVVVPTDVILLAFHGAPPSNDLGVSIISNEGRREQSLTWSNLASYIRLSSPAVVVALACHSADSRITTPTINYDSGTFLGALTGMGVSQIVACQGPIPIGVAATFGMAFWTALINCGSIERATLVARMAVSNEPNGLSELVAAIPALFIVTDSEGHHDGQLFDLEPASHSDEILIARVEKLFEDYAQPAFTFPDPVKSMDQERPLPFGDLSSTKLSPPANIEDPVGAATHAIIRPLQGGGDVNKTMVDDRSDRDALLALYAGQHETGSVARMDDGAYRAGISPGEAAVASSRLRPESPILQLIGRSSELHTLEDAVINGRFPILIHGDSGLGKSVLLAELLRFGGVVQTRYSSHVFWVNARRAGLSGSWIIHELLTALSLTKAINDAPDRRLALLATALETMPGGSLIILDNVDPIAHSEEIRTVIDRLPGGVIIGCTQPIVAARCTKIVRLEMLQANDAKHLLLFHAGLDRIDESTTAIITLLRCHPFAIVLAGCAIRESGVGPFLLRRMLERVDGSVPMGIENRELRVVLQPALELASPAERSLFTTMGVFAESGAGVAAIAAVSGFAIEECREWLSRLELRGLAQTVEAESGHWRTHPMLHRLARSRIEEGEL